MIKRIKKKWLKRLRDPNAKQGRGALKNKDGAMCCLGELCEIAVEEGIATVEFSRGYEYINDNITFMGAHTYIVDDEGQCSLLPEKVKEWAGLKSTSPSVVIGDDPYKALSALNDNGMPFTEIADLIEKQL